MAVIPAIINAILLGRAFDLNTYTYPATPIFHDDVIAKNILTIPKYYTSSEYRMIDSSSDVTDFLDIKGELSLQAKNGNIDISGLGTYLKENIDRENTMEILLKVSFETVIETFPSYLTTIDDWKEKPQKNVGSHFVRSIVYGGQLFISYRMQANSSQYLEHIKAAIDANLQISGSLNVHAKGNFEKLSRDIREHCEETIEAYSTTQPFGPVASFESAFELIDKYPDMVKKINDGKGPPLKVELVSLASLKNEFDDYFRNEAINGILEDVTNKYDDMLAADKRYRDWDGKEYYTEEQQNMVDEFYTQLNEALDVMRDSITLMDASTSGKLDQFDNAFKVYGEGVNNIPYRYSRWLDKIIRNVEKRPLIWQPYTAGVTYYTHWGNTNCTLPSPEPVMTGFAVTTPNAIPHEIAGDGGDFHCFSNNTYGFDKTLEKAASADTTSLITGIRFRNLENKEGLLRCAFCRLENATATFTVPGTTQCPGKTKLEYSGYLNTQNGGTASSMLCLDLYSDVSIKNTGHDESSALKPVWNICRDCDPQVKKIVPCVVCSR